MYDYQAEVLLEVFVFVALCSTKVDAYATGNAFATDVMLLCSAEVDASVFPCATGIAFATSIEC